MSVYIGPMPISQEAPCAVEQISANRSSLTTIDNKAMIPKVGAAARLNHSAARWTAWPPPGRALAV
jgi:hypothetical protein